MISPIKLGTLNVVWVRNNAQTIPHKAPGRAQMIMKGPASSGSRRCEFVSVASDQ
jgi:hypothetical protein